MENSMRIFNVSDIEQAAVCLKQGDLVAFPTETVFGLGAVANNPKAVAKVFEAKGRPSDNPLIVHVADQETVYKYATHVSPVAQQLMDAFWPGPLTILFEVEEGIFAPNVNRGMSTVAMRMPNHSDTLALIRAVGFPIVGPSANISGKPSPTQVSHVVHDFSGRIAGVLDSQLPLLEIGVESTVVAVSNNQVTILRPGAITSEMLESILDVPVIEQSAQEQLKEGNIISPGVKYVHYSPKQPVVIIPPETSLTQWRQIIEEKATPLAILAQEHIVEAVQGITNVVATYSLGRINQDSEATQHLYAGLRSLEDSTAITILAQGFPDRPSSHAYLNRLNRAGQWLHQGDTLDTNGVEK